MSSRTRLIVGCGLALICLTACSRHDNYGRYANLNEVGKTGMVRGGWIPDFLPLSSKNIVEAHDLSPSIGWTTFEFDKRDADEFRMKLEAKNTPTIPLPYIRSPREDWWPRILEGNVDEPLVRSKGLSAYRYTERMAPAVTINTVFFVDWKNARGYIFTGA